MSPMGRWTVAAGFIGDLGVLWMAVEICRHDAH
jgi:hypothetical protein